MATKDIPVKHLTDEDRDNILRMKDAGMTAVEIAKILKFGKSTCNDVFRAIALVRAEDWDECHRMVKANRGKPIEWALKREGKELPPEPKEIPKIVLPIIEDTQQKMDMSAIKEIVNDAISANCKDAKIEQIDKEQMARIMYALGKLDERLETIEKELKTIREEQNANEDNLYKLMVDFRNSVIMELRKRR